ILLAAHWDSRLWADHDPDPSLHHQPILGANDGASGVGVLMEVARCIQSMPISLGVDIIFFDLEDQGIAEWADKYDEDTWCKGSQYWASHPHQPYYQARFGILLDMVGCHQPRFTKEGFSRQYASMITDKIWQIAASLGYESAFQNQKTDPILDDHLYINRIANIPTVDIVQHSVDCSFYSAWHTVNDNLDAVNPQTLKMVGDVVLHMIYSTNQSVTQF
ncbi:MAG: M28 family peptidase, partial [Bacteroidales bacterium]|nr:M28 family peptidase [Candidatus Colimorpha onthohippi]